MMWVIAFAVVSFLLVLAFAWVRSGVLAFDGVDVCLKGYPGTDPVDFTSVTAIDHSYFPIRMVCSYESGLRQDVAPAWTNVLIFTWLVVAVVLVAFEVRRAVRWMMNPETD